MFYTHSQISKLIYQSDAAARAANQQRAAAQQSWLCSKQRLDSIGATTWDNSLKSLTKGGRLITIGRTTGNIGKTNLRLVFWNQLHIIGSTMANRKEFSDVMKLVFQHRLRPVIDSVFPLEQAHLAYQRLDIGEPFGKVIITINN